MKSIIESFIDYLNEFEPIANYNKGNGYVGIEWLEYKDTSFDIVRNPVAGDGVIRTDVLGNKTYQLSVMFRAFFPYTQDLTKAIENHAFFDNFSEWIRDNNKSQTFPELEGAIPKGVYITQTPYLYNVDPTQQRGIYSMILQLTYMKERD